MGEIKEVIVNVEKCSARLNYVIEWIFSGYTDWRYAIKGEEITNKQKVLNYSSKNLSGALNIHSTKWMFEEEMRMPEYQWKEDTYPRLLIEENDHFDALAAIFFLISRIEEYRPIAVDLHGRFPSSSAANKRYLKLPLADIWRKELHQALGIEENGQKNEVQFSFDIDSAYAYKYKGFNRTFGAISRDLLTFQFKTLAERVLSILGLSNDPYDTYGRIIRECNDRKIEITWFFLLSDRTQENNNIQHTSSGLRKLIIRLNDKYNIGIHPGYDTWKDASLMQQEIQRLENITGTPPIHSRQHYLRFSIPETYRILLEEGVRYEYSMGYADAIGFRAGTSRPFTWFDVEKNMVTELMVQPFCAMDVTLARYQKNTIEESYFIIKELFDNITMTGGIFHMLWHNETLSNRGNWLGWSKLWNQVLYSLAPKEVH